MKARPTLKYIEPYIFVLYSLTLDYNLPPGRILKMWKDTSHLEPIQGEYAHGYTKHQKLTQLVGKLLQQFWSGFKAFYYEVGRKEVKEVIYFVKKHSVSRWTRWFYRV